MGEEERERKRGRERERESPFQYLVHDGEYG